VETSVNTGPLDWLASLVRPSAPTPVCVTVHIHVGGQGGSDTPPTVGEVAEMLSRAERTPRTQWAMNAPAASVQAEPARPIRTDAPPAIEPFIAGWVNDKKRRGHRDVRRAEAMLRAVVKACGWGTLADATPASLTAELARRHGEGDKSRTLNKVQSTVSSFIGWCCRTYPDVVPFNWAKSIARAEEDDATEGRRFLTPDELQALLGWASGLGLERAAFYATLAGTGMRLGEAASLRRSQVVLDGVPRIELTRATKSRKARVIPLPADLVAVLRPRCAGDPHARVFSERPTLRTLAADCERAGIDPTDVGFHSFRKSYASGLALKGVPLSVAQKVLGHSDPKLTAGIYQKFQHAQLAEALGVMETPQKKGRAHGENPLDSACALADDVDAASVLEPSPESSVPLAALQSNDPMSGPVPPVQGSSGMTLAAAGGAGPALAQTAARALGREKAASRTRTGDPRFTNAHVAGRTGHSLRFGDGEPAKGRRMVPRGRGQGQGLPDLHVRLTGAAGGSPENIATLLRAIAEMLSPSDGGVE